MNMISLPRPECPYCHEAMRRWPLGQHMLVCDTCRRPIVRYLAAPSRRIFRLRPLYSVINAIALFILVATFLAIVIARADIRHIMLAVAIHIAMFGASDIGDGWLSWRTSLDRGWNHLRKGRKARLIGLARAAFGIAGCAVAIFGLLAYGDMTTPRKPLAHQAGRP